MKTHDPFLRHLFSVVDRAIVWMVLAIVLSALVWTVAWERGLGLPVMDGWHALALVMSGQEINRTVLTLLTLSGALGVTTASVISASLFRRWKHQAVVDVTRLRGVRWESEK